MKKILYVVACVIVLITNNASYSFKKGLSKPKTTIIIEA